MSLPQRIKERLAGLSGLFDLGGRTVEVPIPDGAERVTLSCERAFWRGLESTDNAVEVRLDISLDGGQTWEFLLGFTTSFGDVYPGVKRGEPVPEGLLPYPASTATFSLPRPDLPGRLARTTLRNFRVLRTAVDIDWE